MKAWVEVEEAKVAAAEAAAAVVEEEEGHVGPTLPGQDLINKAKANMGGFLLPGEGDRYVAGVVCWCGVELRRGLLSRRKPRLLSPNGI